MERATEVGNPRALGLCQHALGAVLFQRGEWYEARQAFERSVELARSFDGVFGEVLGEQRLGLLETGLGQYERAHDRLVSALKTARASSSQMVRAHGIGRILATLARNRFEAGDTAGATRYLTHGFAVAKVAGECPSCDAILFLSAVPIFIALDDTDQAEQACHRAEEVARSFRSRTWVAAARYLRGTLAAHAGDRQLAIGSLEAARDLFAELEQPYDLARSIEALADVSEGIDQSPSIVDSDRMRQDAIEIYSRLGAVGDLQRLGVPISV